MKYDIAIIGGGPAGLMAAGRAAELGARVLVLERNNRPGVKLLISGNGRCNITNKTKDVRMLVKKYGNNGPFLFHALHRFGVTEMIEFLKQRGVQTKVERFDKVFPVSDEAQDVLSALLEYIDEGTVDFMYNVAVEAIKSDSGRIKKLILENNETVIADSFIIATGGKSYPVFGARGDGYVWAKELGHDIVPVHASLTPIVVSDRDMRNLRGVSLRDCGVRVYHGDTLVLENEGDVMFTADGLSGPAILNVSKVAGEGLPGTVRVVLDLVHKKTVPDLDAWFQQQFHADGKKFVRTILVKLMPKRLVAPILQRAGIETEELCARISKEKRQALVKILHALTFKVDSLAGFKKSVVTAGGVSLKQVDPQTMRSRIIENLYFAGEVLDLDGPTGGFNLQICWSTGFVAGDAAAQG